MDAQDKDYRNPSEELLNELRDLKRKESLDGLENSGFRLSLRSKYPKALRHYLSLFPNQYLDIFELKEKEALKLRIKSFSDLLSKDTTGERDILKHINDNENFYIIGAVLKKYFNFGHHEAHVFREFPLGTSYYADYLLLGKNSDGWHMVFVELEAPKGAVTLKDGELGNVFRKGLVQVEDWKYWLEGNFSALREFFMRHKGESSLPEELLTYDSSRIKYVVVAGRRSDFCEKTYRIQRKKIIDSQVYMIHYDNLVDGCYMLLDGATY